MRGDVEQIVDQSREVLHLPADHRALVLDPSLTLQVHQRERRGDGRERISKLMAEHGQELVLAPIGGARALDRALELLFLLEHRREQARVLQGDGGLSRDTRRQALVIGAEARRLGVAK